MKYKPVIQKSSISEIFQDPFFDAMYEVRCGNCDASFGSSSGDRDDTGYYEENFKYCPKCGEPVEWEKDSPDNRQNKEPVEPVIKQEEITDIETGEIDIDMSGIYCGKCNCFFGLTDKRRKDMEWFQNNYRFCPVCDTPVKWR